MNSSDRQDIARLVALYCSDERNPTLPAFTIHPHTPESWRETKECGTPGCYVGYLADGSLRYIGKASQHSVIGTRLWTHLRAKTHFEHVLYLDIIPTRAFEAPSLEEYLQTNIQDYNGRFGSNLQGTDTPSVAEQEVIPAHR